MQHKPVLLNEVIKILDPKPGEFFIDGTANGGGHLVSILEKMDYAGMILAIDWDKNILERTKNKIETKFQIPNSQFQIYWINDNYKNMKKILKENNLQRADGILLDLGFSSEQLESSGRGFSFNKDEPLDMRYCADKDTDNDYDNNCGNEKTITAAEVVNTFSENTLANIFKDYGEERYAKQIAKRIFEKRKQAKILKSSQLAQLIYEVYCRCHSHRYRHGQYRIHPATRTFQALRIFVNQELENLRSFLTDLPMLLAPGGRAAVISFHSLEDRLVKLAFRNYVKEGVAEFLTKKPVTATKDEIRENPRSRSAKLRAIKFS